LKSKEKKNLVTLLLCKREITNGLVLADHVLDDIALLKGSERAVDAGEARLLPALILPVPGQASLAHVHLPTVAATELGASSSPLPTCRSSHCVRSTQWAQYKPTPKLEKAFTGSINKKKICNFEQF
jgi:hypothetical protein